jgi:hypothetical protein
VSRYVVRGQRTAQGLLGCWCRGEVEGGGVREQDGVGGGVGPESLSCSSLPTCHHDSLTYELTGLDVIGEPDPVDIRIRFYTDPPYPTYGQRPEDFPRVHAKPGARSKHRYSFDDALCLWFPLDPDERRWTSSRGLLDLIEIRTHLFLEHYWRLTGGESGGQWLFASIIHESPSAC